MKHARANFMTPIPQAASFEELNARLAAHCRTRRGERAGRHAITIGERLSADLAVLRALPAVPLEPCEKRSGRVSSTALVRYRCNDYSVPTTYGFQDVMVKGFVDEVVILCGGHEIARHPRCYGDGVFVADPLHYLALLEMKPAIRWRRCRAGRCPRCSSICATCWRRAWATAASVSLSRYCG